MSPAMLHIEGFASITALKRSLPVTAKYLHGRAYHGDGSYVVMGPTPTRPLWRARVRVLNGSIVSVIKMPPLRPGG